MDNMQLWLSSSTDSINLNDSAEGFYLNPDLEGLTGLPEIRSVNGLNAGYDGGWTATQLWAARLITIRGIIAINDKAAVETKRKALAKLLAQGKNEDLELRFVSEAGDTYTTTVRTTNCTMALQRVFWRQEYQIQLRANDPLIYDDGGSELIAILRVMAGEGGFEIPFDIPFTIGGSIEPTSVDVGDEATYPLIRLKGDLHNPTIINMTTNQRMQVLADIITTIEWRDYTTTYTTNGYAQIGDGLDGAPLSLTHLYGNATQETTTGKNLLSITSGASMNQGTYVSGANTSEYKIKATGNDIFVFNVAQVGASYNSAQQSNLIACNYGETIYFSVGNTNFVKNYFTEWDENQLCLGYTLVSSSSGSYTPTRPTCKYITFRFGNGYSVVDTTYTLSPIVCKTSDTTYEPYTAGASPNPDYPQDVNVVSGAQTVKTCRKNLLDFDAFLTAGGATWTKSGNVYAITDNGSIYNNRYPLNVENGKTYTISQKYHPQGTTNLRLDIFKNGVQFFSCYATNQEETAKTFIADSSVYTMRANWSVSSLPSYFEEPMLEESATPTAYEPYQGQSYEINLGKNLVEEIIATTNIDASGVVVSYADTQLGIAKVEQGKTYVLSASGQAVYGFFTTKPVLGSVSYNGQRIVSNTMYFTAPISGYIAFRSSNGYTTQQCELGMMPTSYVAYKTPIELAKIGTYQDYIWNDDGTWKIHKEVGKVVFVGDNSEGWWLQSGTTNEMRAPFSGSFSGAPLMSDYFHDGTSTSEIGTMRIYTNGYIRAISNQTSANDFKTWLSTHNTTVYYALATPTDTEITDSELIEQLNHIYSLYGGVNNIMLIPSAGAQGEMEVSYATTEDIDYHEVVIDCQARTVTQDGHNLYPALAEGSEFIRLLPGENKLYLTSEVESDDGTAEVKFKKGNISI